MSYLQMDDSENRARWRKWLHKEHFGKKMLLAIGFILALAAFLHFRTISIEVLELNSTAQRYIIGQVDFEFLDVDAMMILKQEQIRDIGTIYKIDSKEISRNFAEFKKYLLESQEWREQSTLYTYNDLSSASEALEKTITKWRFTDKRTIKKIQELHLPATFYSIWNEKNKTSSMVLSSDVWKQMERTLLPGASYSEADLDFVVGYFSKRTWITQEDLAKQLELRLAVEENIPKKYSKFEAGRRIINAGEKVSPRHIAILNAMKSALAKQRNLLEPVTILGSILLSSIFTLSGILYLRKKHKEVFHSLQKMTLLVTILLVTLILAKVIEYTLFHPTHHLVDIVHFPIIIPFAAILVSVLFGRTIALFSIAYLSVILSISLAFPFVQLLVMNLVTAVVSMMYAKTMHKRRDIFLVCTKLFLWAISVIIINSFIANEFWSDAVFVNILSSFVFFLLISLIIIGLLPLLESSFDVLTDMSLVEYMDPNNELLRRLSFELPGTYHHCLVVANLAEAAAQTIGANGLFCRVSSLYHDIGKLSNPHYFTENQLGGFNIHQLLTPIESTQVIKAHVHDGELLAKKHHLPQSFIDIIKEHHGTTLVYYFYRKYLDQKSEDTTAIDESQFRYAGPKPKTKESALIMLADSVEATSRSLDEISEKTIVEMVDRVVREKTDDGQLNECQLTFEDLGMIKKSLAKTLIVTLHLRVKYPKKTEKQRMI